MTTVLVLPEAKFSDPDVTAKGERRARVALRALRTLWINTGTLCNITCRNCYIESSPTNDRLAYISRAEAAAYLDEIARHGLPVTEIGFTGGEPFLNPDMLGMLEDALTRGFAALVLTNAMQPMLRPRIQDGLLALREAFGSRLTLRVSLDHYSKALHEDERGPDTFDKTLEGIDWLSAHGFSVALAGRTCWGETEANARDGYAALVADRGWPIDAHDPGSLVLFPEMDERADVPEITESCWGILGKAPEDVMCASKPHGGEAARGRCACGAAMYPVALRSRLRDGCDLGGRGKRGRRHVRPRGREALPSALRQILCARRGHLLGLSAT
ncbi:MAG: radical SAM protein [Hyphomicrobiales bacterium]